MIHYGFSANERTYLNEKNFFLSQLAGTDVGRHLSPIESEREGMFLVFLDMADKGEQACPKNLTIQEGECSDMNSIASYDFSTADHTSLATGGRDYSASEVTRVTSSLQQDTDVTIVTAEEDKVTLSSASQYHTAYATYEGVRCIGGDFTEVQGQSLSLGASRELSVMVDGNLNKEELKDIEKAMRTIDNILRNFLSGDIDHAASELMKINALKSISSLEASLQFEQNLSLDQGFTQETMSTPTELSQNMMPKGDTPGLDHLDKLADEVTQVVKDSGIRPASLLKPIQKLFSHLLKGLSATEEGFVNSPKLQAAKLIESHLLEKVKRWDEDEQGDRENGIPGNCDEGNSACEASVIQDLA